MNSNKETYYKYIHRVEVAEYQIGCHDYTRSAVASTDSIASILQTACVSMNSKAKTREEIHNATKTLYSWDVIGKKWIDLIESIEEDSIGQTKLVYTRI